MPEFKTGLSSAGFREMAKNLRNYAQKIKDNSEKLKEELCEIGKTEIDRNYAEGFLYTGKEPNIRTEITDKGVTASGEGFSFIEFGTGVNNKESPLADRLSVKHGEYGKGHGKRYKWVYYGEPGNNAEQLGGNNRPDAMITKGADAHNGVYNSSVTMRSKLEETAKEVFK